MANSRGSGGGGGGGGYGGGYNSGCMFAFCYHPLLAKDM